MIPAVNNINSYMDSILSYPLLTAEEEQALAYKYQQNNDLESAKTLILSNLRYVVYVAREFVGYRLPLCDLVQEGNIGLMKAVQKFMPNMNTRLVTFATSYIKSEIYDFIVKNLNIVNIATTKAKRKLFFNLRRHITNNRNSLSVDQVREISEKLNVSQKDVIEMERRFDQQPIGFDECFDDTEISPSDTVVGDVSPIEYLISEEKANGYNDVVSMIDNLNDRERDIIHSRWISDKKVTLRELASKYNLSLERVRQIEKDVFARMRRMIWT